MQSRRDVLVYLAIFAIAVCAVGCSQEPVEPARAGGAAPTFTLKDRDGHVVSSESFRGRIVLLTFWTTTCQPCLREVPDLQRIDGLPNVTVVAVALHPEGWLAITPAVERHQMHYRVVLGDEELFQRCGGYALPHSLLIDHGQRVAKVYRGAVSFETVEADVKALNGR